MPKRLLVADDSLTIRKVIGMVFAAEDFEITSVDNGLEAINRAREMKPDLVLADVAMPGRSGYEVSEALKGDSKTQSIPVLLLAGTFEPFDENRARAVKADDYILKPFESGALLEKVRALTGLPKGASEPVRPSFTAEVRAGMPRPPAAPGRLPSAVTVPSAPSFAANGPPRPTVPSYALGQSIPRPSAPTGAAPTRPAPPTPLASADLARPPAPRMPTPAHISLGAGRPVSPVTRPAGAVASPVTTGPSYSPRPQSPQPMRASPMASPASAVAPVAAPLPPIVAKAPFAPIGSYESLRPAETAARTVQMARDGGEALLREALSKASREVIEKVVWEVVPQLAETIIREHLDELVKSRGGQN